MINLAFSAFLLGFVAMALYYAIKEDCALYAAILSPLTLLQCVRVYVAWVSA